MKQFFFISGLPRAGSTLLANILCQNPDIYASATSGLVDMMVGARNRWDKLPEHKAMDTVESMVKKINMLRFMMNGYYQERPEPIIIDKSRGWLAYIEMLAAIGIEVKALAMVRPLPEILASIEMLWRNTSQLRQMSEEQENYLLMQTIAGRCEVWVRGSEFLGLAANRLKDALQRGHGDKVKLIDYDLLTRNPVGTLKGIYEFLGLEPFAHDFDNVRQVTRENDELGYGIPNLHNIRPQVLSQPHKAAAILGPDVAIKYSNLMLWDKDK